MDRKDYRQMTETELYGQAREKGIPGKSKMNKEQLIHALETYERPADLHSLDMHKLHEIAKEKGVAHLWDMRKEELIENIRYKEKMGR